MSEEEPILAGRAGHLAGRAARAGYAASRRLPGVDVAERGLREAERQLLTRLRRRLDRVDDPYHAALASASAMTGGRARQARGNGAVTPGEPAEPLRAAMAELLDRSTGFGRERAREYLYAIILRQLTPDEARILAALSDGSPFPLVDVAERTGLGGTGRFVLRNASTVGKVAGVSLPDHVPAYLTRLLVLGLVELDEEVPSLVTQYEILLTDDTVRRAETLVKRAKFVRRTIRVSALGSRFLAACDPSTG